MLDGHGKVEEYLARAKALGMVGLATTDHGNIHSWLDFYDAGMAVGVKPILGSEMYQSRKSRFDRDEEERSGPSKNEWEQRGPYHITILAKNNIGYHNIIKLSSRAFIEGYYVKPRVDHQLISEHSEGIIVLSGCLNGEVSQALLRNDYATALRHAAEMQSIVGRENYFIEIMNHDLEEQKKIIPDLIKIATTIGAKLIPTGDCHYVHQHDAKSHDIMLCQPPGTLVLVANTPSKKGLPRGTSVITEIHSCPIEDIKVGDKVVSWNSGTRRGVVKRSGDIVTAVGQRFYRDDLIQIELPDGVKSSYTKDHICIARITSDYFKGKHAVYLMKKGNRYRIGCTKFIRTKNNLLGIRQRSKENNADASWILACFDTEKAARAHEEICSLIFQIPTWTFYEALDRPNFIISNWEFIEDNTVNAVACLEHHSKDIKYPLWTRETKISQRTFIEIRALNLLDGMLVCQFSKINNKNGTFTTNHGSSSWQQIKVTKVPFKGTVYSIEVDNVNTYIADDIVTHNCVATNANINTPNRFSFTGDKFYLQSYDEMASIFSDDWLKNTMHINDMIDVNLSFGEIHFPHFPIPTKETSTEYFERLAWEGLVSRYGSPLPQHIIDRANHEIRVVEEMGFSEYFLVVSDLVRWAKDNGIRVGWGRGSAAGSVLSYAFDITNLDPIRFGLMFERFLVEGRKSMPDIDLDFDDRYRDQVIEYARSKYGDDKVAHICTFNRTGARQSLRDSARALGYEFASGDRIARLVPPPVLGLSRNLKECMDVTEFKAEYNLNSDSKLIVDTAIGLEGLVRQTGIHAAGVVISKGPLTDYLPVMKKGLDAPLVTQWDMGRVEQCGLLKIDFLGLRNLGVIDSCLKLIKKTRKEDIDIELISLEDQKTFDELCKGNSVGVFQLESSSMRQMMVGLQPKSIEEIMALISLHRPGPMGSGMDREYIDRKHGRSIVRYEHPKLKSVLEASLGIMLYQEDVLAVSRELAGFSSAEADDLRKVIGKKQMEKIALMRSIFVQGCIKTSGIGEQLANKIFSDIEYFAGYGFNRAHAASYAMISYTTAYLKANYTLEYMAALMSSVVGNKDKQSLYLSDCRKLGINVLPPSINYSGTDFEVVGEDSIIFGLSAIDGIGVSIADIIVNSRDISNPYNSLHDFYRRCDPSTLKKSTLENLALAGALDELVEEQTMDLSRRIELEVLEKEKEKLGVYVTSHPILGIWDILKNQITHEILDLSEIPTGSSVKIGGIITSNKKMITKKGQKMYRIEIEDISSSIEVIVFPKNAKDIEDSYFNSGDIFVINGFLNRENDEENSITKLFYNSSERIDPKIFSGGKPIILNIKNNISQITFEKIYEIISIHKGNSPMFLEMVDKNHKFVYKFDILSSSKALPLIEKILELEINND